MNDGNPSCNQKKDLTTCVKSSMNNHWNRAVEDDPSRQSNMHWNHQYPGTNKAFSPTLPPAAVPSSAFIPSSAMSSSHDTPLSTNLQTLLPSFLPQQQLVWPTMTPMTMNPSSFYLTSMPSMPSQPAFYIPMPVYGCAYPNNNNSGSSFSFPPRVAAPQGSYYMIQQPPMILPPQLPVMLPTATTRMQPDYSSSMLRSSSSSSHVFPTRFDNKEDPYNALLSLKTQARDDNESKAKHETQLSEKNGSVLLPQESKNSSQSSSVKRKPLESLPAEEAQHAAIANNYHGLEKNAASSKENKQGHPSSTTTTTAAAAERESLNKPKRALSAYNLFFKDQRELMLRRQEEKEEEEEQQLGRVPKRCRGGGTRRRKHGIRFEHMAREIAQLWKHVDPHVMSHYAVIAERDKQRYQQEKELYMQQQMNLMETTRQQLEATVSDVARQNYLAKAGSSANSSEGIASKKKRKID